MIEEFEHKGIWWLPDNPEKQINGTLKFSPKEGATLDLIGSFNDHEKVITKMQTFPIILGTTADGKEITLINCYKTTNTMHIPGITTCSFGSVLIFRNVHFHTLEDIRFRNIVVHYSHLDDWVGISGFDIQYNLKDGKEVIIKYKEPTPIQFDLGDYKISIIIETTYPKHTIVQKKANIKQTAYIKIESPGEKPFDEYRNVMLDIGNFLSLGVGKPVYPLIIKGTTEKNKQLKEEGKPLYHSDVEIFYEVSDFLETSEVLSSQMLFTFEDVEDKFGNFLRNWFEKLHSLKPTFNLYFGVLYNSHLYLESQFLNLTQAIESYHQHIYGGKYTSEEEYRAVYDALIKAIPEKTKDSLKARLKEYLKYGNEFSLRTRIKEIVDSYSEIWDYL
jgi:hypothetical protein